MATLLLSGLGSAVGGQLGGLAGALLGKSIDGQLFSRRSTGVKEDLTVSTASYGRSIPRIYGRMRVGGAIVWARDLQVQQGSSGGKYGPNPTIYRASFAVALSSRPAARIGRIWADGRLLRGADGDFKVATKFRFHPGDEDQTIDPLIASVEGPEAASAFRGLCLAVFEDLQLTEFGNRVPMLTFELEADDQAPKVNDIIADLLGESFTKLPLDPVVKGFAAVGENTSAAVSDLVEAYGVAGIGEGWRPSEAGRERNVLLEELGCSSGKYLGPEQVRRQPTSKVPQSLRLGYFDHDLELQASEQRVTWSAPPGFEERLEVPALLTASEAKCLAQSALSRRWKNRESRTLHLPPTFLDLRPGDLLVLPDAGKFSVDQVDVDGLAVVVRCSRPEQVVANLSASSGRIVASADLKPPRSELALLDLPAMQTVPTSPALSIAARGGAMPWRALRCTIMAQERAGEQFMLQRRAVMGIANTALAAGTPELIDRRNSVIVALADDDWLQSCTDGDLLSGANLALVGDEVIQFADVRALGAGRFSLHHLLRGRYGTDWACALHAAGERFVLLAPDLLNQADIRPDWIGSTIEAEAQALGDGDQPSEATIDFHAEALRPPAPVHLCARVTAEGGVAVSWVRRSRCGYQWFDHLDVPLGEEREEYLVKVTGLTDSLEVSSLQASCGIDADRARLLGGGPLTIEVAQLGRALPSRFASIQLRI